MYASVREKYKIRVILSLPSGVSLMAYQIMSNIWKAKNTIIQIIHVRGVIDMDMDMYWVCLPNSPSMKYFIDPIHRHSS